MTRRHLLVLAIGVMALTGCSLMFVRPVPPGRVHHETSGGCTESKAPPVVDSIVTALEVLRTGYDLVAPDSAYRGATLSRMPSIALGTLLVAAFASSASYGFSATDKCWQVRERERFEAPHARVTRRPLQPRDLVPPPMPPPYAPPPSAAADADGGTEDAQPAGPDAVVAPPPARPAAPAVRQQLDTE